MIATRPDAGEQSALDRTPFGLLGVTARDQRRRIVELAEEKSLTLDPEACARARADLTNPRNRLGAEIAWLPGLSPTRANAYREQLKRDLDGFLAAATAESPLVRANLLAAGLERFDPATPAETWQTWILALADASGSVDLEAILRLLNEDRAVAGFPEIQTPEFLEAEMTERRSAYREVLKAALDRLPTATILEVLTRTVDGATASGSRAGPILLDDLVDAFELEARRFLDREAESAQKLFNAVREAAGGDERVVSRLLDGLERVARNFDRVAKPIQVSLRARGLEHGPSRDLAIEIRSLGIDLYNKHSLLGPAQRITTLLRDLFADLLVLADRLAQDATALDNIAEERRKAKEQNEQWAREIFYEAELGLVFKDRLRISVDGIDWKDARYPLDGIAAIGWGATRHSVNGIPTGTTHNILFGGVTVSFSGQEQVFNEFVERLWRAVGVRLLTELLQKLRNGTRYHFGDAIVDDAGIELPRHHFFKADERVRCTWDQVHVWSADGSFYAGLKDDKKVYASLSYQAANNAHVLEAAIRAAFKRGPGRLSDLLQPS